MINGFPSVGLVSSIVANYLLNVLEPVQIGVLDSPQFPAISIVRDTEPLNAVRIYAGEKVGDSASSEQLVIFISEFQPPKSQIKAIASTILDWVQEQKCRLLISPEGLEVDRKSGKEDGGEGGEHGEGESGAHTTHEGGEELPTYGVASTARARTMLEEHAIPLFKEGVITGIAGVLLNEGKKRDFDVISLLAEAHTNIPDARAAAKVIEALDKFILHIKLDPQPLYLEAERIEHQLKALHRQAKAMKELPTTPMYR